MQFNNKLKYFLTFFSFRHMNKYKMNFKMENLKLLNGDYNVFVSSKNISQFKHTESDLEYFIALEPDSKYNA